MQLKDKTFLVTGGASGLGRACAERFAHEGANVMILDSNEEAGQAAVRELGSRARFARTNVASEQEVQKTIDSALEDFGALHGAICCAGIAIAEKVLNKEGKPHALASFSKTIEINLVGTFNVIRLAAAAIASGKQDEGGERGVFITTASIAAYEGQWGQSAYAASKGGLIALTTSLSKEVGELGIRINIVAPHGTGADDRVTPRNYGVEAYPSMPGTPVRSAEERARESSDRRMSDIPMRRQGRAEEQASAIAFLLSEDASYITGQVLPVGGGATYPF